MGKVPCGRAGPRVRTDPKRVTEAGTPDQVARAYFLSEDDAGALGAEAAGAAAGVADGVAAAGEAAVASAELDGEGLAEAYPSAYQPPPLRAKAGAVMTRFNSPLQCGQTVISGSENFWIFSVWRWQARHSYS